MFLLAFECKCSFGPYILFLLVAAKLASPSTYVYKSLDGTTKIVIVFTTEKDVDYHKVFGTTDIDLYETKV